MKAKFLLFFLSLFSSSLEAVQRFSTIEKLQDMKEHQEELEYQKKILDKDLKATAGTLKILYPQCQNLNTQLHSFYEDIKNRKKQIQVLKKREDKLKQDLKQVSIQLAAVRKHLYLNKKFNKKLPPFLLRGHPDEAVNHAVIRLETREKIIYNQIQHVQEAMRENQNRISTMRQKIAQIRPIFLKNKEKYKSVHQMYEDLKLQRLDYMQQKKTISKQREKYLRKLPDRFGLFSKPFLIQPAMGDVEYLEENYNAFHAGGAVIMARPGQDVICPGNGKVSFRGPLRRFGHIVLIDHGQKLFTLISGLNPTVHVGQPVKRGEVIGKVSQELQGRLYVELLKEGRTRLVTFH